MRPSLYIFNPQTDICLANGTRHLSLTRKVEKFRREKALLPAIYAPEGSLILASEEATDYRDVALARGMRVISPEDLAGFDGRVIPWGWDLALLTYLKERGVDGKSLPTEREIANLREMRHRRHTIDFHRMCGDYSRWLPREIAVADQAREAAGEWHGAYFKVPWSSSGRGVFHTGQEITPKEMERILSVIRRQGSIMAEYPYSRQMDFASEWIMSDGIADFKGFSWFATSVGGNYLYNHTLPQEEIRGRIQGVCPGVSTSQLIDVQKLALKSLFPRYSGPVGIDMLADAEGRINPCVEINLRMTMGHLALHAHRLWPERPRFIP